MRPVHPGEAILKEVMEPSGISLDEIARKSGIPPWLIMGLIKGTESVNEDIAQRLEIATGIASTSWVKLQKTFDESVFDIQHFLASDAHCDAYLEACLEKYSHDEAFIEKVRNDIAIAKARFKVSAKVSGQDQSPT